MVTELINHIDVYHATRINGEITQEIKIYYNCIGAFDVPDRELIPELKVLIEPRKGVALSYSQARKAGKRKTRRHMQKQYKSVRKYPKGLEKQTVRKSRQYSEGEKGYGHTQDGNGASCKSLGISPS